MKKKIIIIILIIFFVFSIVPRTFQNDIFYTVTIGRDILRYGFDGVEHYSWHEGLSYTSPHWLFDIVNYLIYNVADFDGLYIFTCIIATITMLLFYWILRKKDINSIVALCGTLVVAYLLKDFFTDRAYCISYMLFLIEIYLLESFLKDKNKKSVVGIFIISVIVANIHAAAWILMIILVLPYLGEYIFSLYAIDNVVRHFIKKNEKKVLKLKKKSANKEKIKQLEDSIEYDKNFIKNYKPNENAKVIIHKNDNAKYLILIIFIILLGGLFTPTGSLPYTYFIKASMGNAMNYINEHLPIVIASSLEFVVVIIFTVTCIGFIDSKIKLSDGFLLLGLYLMTIYSRRHLVLLILLCSPILIKMIDIFIKKYSLKTKPDNQIQIFENYFLAFIAIVAVFVGIYQIVQKYDDDYIDETLYPTEASEWLLDYIEENDIEIEEFRIYNQYNYGSYLLYKGIPVFIDSRAEQPYCDEFNEGVTVFDDYMEVASGLVHYSELFEQYDINYAIVYQDSMENTYMKEDENCVELYSDEYFVIYQYLK